MWPSASLSSSRRRSGSTSSRRSCARTSARASSAVSRVLSSSSETPSRSFRRITSRSRSTSARCRGGAARWASRAPRRAGRSPRSSGSFAGVVPTRRATSPMRRFAGRAGVGAVCGRRVVISVARLSAPRPEPMGGEDRRRTRRWAMRLGGRAAPSARGSFSCATACALVAAAAPADAGRTGDVGAGASGTRPLPAARSRPAPTARRACWR